MTIILVTNLMQQARRLAGPHDVPAGTARSSSSTAREVIFSDTPRAASSTYDYVNGIFG